MVYELRVYHAAPGKLASLSKRFETITVRMFEKHGIRPLGFWTTVIGASNNDLTYLLEWESLAEREEKWNAFMTDPEWIRERAESESNGPLYTYVTNAILSPTSYSQMR